MKLWLLWIGITVLALGCASTGGVLQDFDGDGSFDMDDCAPDDASIYPGSADDWGDPLGVDSNCDGADGIDQDGDGWAVNAGGADQDCNDDDPNIHSDASDSVGDGIDQNCDGADGVDSDGDLRSSMESGGEDCDDTSAAIYPGASDAWGNGVDEDCDNCPPGAGDGIDTDCDGYALNGPGFDQDCDDADAGIHPGSVARWESPGLALDVNCDGSFGTPLDSVSPSFLGEYPDDESGNRLASAGDVNGDGLDDLLIAAPYNDEGGDSAGKTYLVFGKSALSDWNTDLSSSDVSFLGASPEGKSGKAVAGAGDVDGDGLSDILIGEPGYNGGDGRTYLFLGSTVASGGSFDLNTADAIFTGQSGEASGYAVAGVGDVDGDGHDDVLVGAWSNDQGEDNAGKSYLILAASLLTRLYQQPQGLVEDLSAVADIVFVGEYQDDESGDAVAGAGDVDGDGLADVLIGAWSASGGHSNGEPSTSDRGRAYLYYGSTLAAGVNFGASFDLAFADAIFEGEELSEAASAIATAGDVNGDGLDDFMIGASKESSWNIEGGASYVFFGRTEGFSGHYSLGDADVRLLGENAFDESGRSLSTAGDVDGDGYSDLLIGAVGNDEGGSTAGKTYLVLAADIQAGGTHELSSAAAAFIGEEQYDRSGDVVSTAGDVNGDGLDDFMIGAEYADIRGEDVGQLDEDVGKTYLLLSPFESPNYSGLWTLSPAISYSCWSETVSVELEHLNVDYRPSYAGLDPAIIVGAYELTMNSRTVYPGSLVGGFATADVFAVSGGTYIGSSACTVTWSFTGSYTGPDTLSADFTATFTGSCGDCTNQSFPITATR